MRTLWHIVHSSIGSNIPLVIDGIQLTITSVNLLIPVHVTIIKMRIFFDTTIDFMKAVHNFQECNLNGILFSKFESREIGPFYTGL